MIHHGTIKNYVATLLDVFNNLEVQYTDSSGNVKLSSVPIVYSSKEKAMIIDRHTGEQLKSGNYNVLPRASISLSSLTKIEQRTLNKNTKTNKKSNADTFDYMFNSVPYEFTFELNVMCRGMNEATQIIEQIAPKFNPVLSVDIWDAQNLSAPTRVPVKLLDISVENEEYDEYSSNISTVSIGVSVTGNLYPPVKTLSRIKQFKMSTNEVTPTSNALGLNGEPAKMSSKDTFARKNINNWDVPSSGVLNQHSTTVPVGIVPPVIVDVLTTSPITLGNNTLTVIYTDPTTILTDMTFTWNVIQSNATVVGTLDTAVLNVTTPGITEISVTVQNAFGQYATLSKIYTV